MEQQHCVAYEMEFMKMAMLKHEEIFKQQVYELHRVYRIQKMLMKTTRRQNYISGSNSMNNDQNTRHAEKHMLDLIRDLDRPTDQKCSFNMGQRVVFEAEEDGAIDLTLGLGIISCNNDSGKLHEKPSSVATRQLTSDSVMSFSSSSSGSSRHLKRACEGRIRINDEEHQELFQRAAAQPAPWLLQALSLNMT